MPPVVVPFEGGSLVINAPGRPGIDKLFNPLNTLDSRSSSLSVLHSSLAEIAFANGLDGNAFFQCLSSPLPNDCNLYDEMSFTNTDGRFFVDLAAKTVHRVGEEVVPLSSKRLTKSTDSKYDRLMSEVVAPGDKLDVTISLDPPKDKRKGSVIIKTLTGKQLSVHFDGGMTIDCMKREIEDIDGLPAWQQRLIFAGKQLEDRRTAADYDIQSGSVVHMVMCLRGGICTTFRRETRTFALSRNQSLREGRALTSSTSAT